MNLSLQHMESFIEQMQEKKLFVKTWLRSVQHGHKGQNASKLKWTFSYNSPHWRKWPAPQGWALHLPSTVTLIYWQSLTCYIGF